MSAQNTFMTAIKASERGAYEYLPKPFDLKELVSIVGRALGEPKRRRESADEPAPVETMPLVGRSPAMQDIFRSLARLMQTDLTVMISGESGTGKELVARALHDYGKRKSGPFVAINMAAIPRDLIESELFGHEKGAFTGANARSVGRFEQAEGGTLFLDEIGDMPMEAQTRLLRVLQQGEYTTVGGRTPIKTNVRIVAATNKDLRHRHPAGRVPRRPVFPPQCRAAASSAAARAHRGHSRPRAPFLPARRGRGAAAEEPGAAALDRLRRYPGPATSANSRTSPAASPRSIRRKSSPKPSIDSELELRRADAEPGCAERRGAGAASAQIAPSAQRTFHRRAREARRRPFPLVRRFAAAGRPLSPGVSELEAPLIAATLAATRGNQIKAAEILGLNRNTLRKKIRDLDLRGLRGIKIGRAPLLS